MPGIRVIFVDIAEIIADHRDQVDVMKKYFSSTEPELLMPGENQICITIWRFFFMSGDSRRQTWMNEGENANDAFNMQPINKVLFILFFKILKS